MAGEYVLSVILNAQNRAAGTIAGFVSSLGPIGGVAAVAGAALVGLGVASTNEAGDFQQAMLSNVAHAGLAKSEFQKTSDAILAMAPAVGRAPTQLAEAMYPILSAFSGIQNQSAKSAIALATLKMSFQAVAGTTVNGTDVANAAVGTFNALGLATNNVATNQTRMKNLFDVMDLTVQHGNMQWGAYQSVISKLAISIQGTGISFNEASAALSTMTNEGFSAQKAQTYLSNTFNTMAIKTDVLAKHAKSLGISFNEPAYSSMNLAEKIGYLNKITDGNKQKILALMGNNSTALKTFNALSTGIKEYGSDLQAYGHAQGALQASFDTASKGFKFQLSQIKAAGDALMVTIGTKLLPVLSELLAKVLPLITQFSDWLTKSGALDNVAQGLATSIGVFIAVLSRMVSIGAGVVSFFQHNQVAMDALKSVLVGVGVGILLFAMTQIPALIVALGAWAVAQWAVLVPVLATAAPFIAIGILVAAVVFAIIEVIRNWGAISKWLEGVWSAACSAIGSFFSGLGSTIRSILNAVAGFFRSTWNSITSGIQTFAGNVSSSLQGLISTIRGFFAALPGEALQWGENLIQSFIQGIQNMIGAAGQAASNVVSTVKNFLGFHSPAKEGPGSDADTWAPNLMKMYAKGIQGGLPGIKNAVKASAELMKAGFTGDANALNQKINIAQYQEYVNKKAQAEAKYKQAETKHYDQWLAAQHKRYEKYLTDKQKALEKYDKEKKHKKPFEYHAFKLDQFKALKETLPKFTGLSLGAFANQTNILNPDMGNGAPMQLPAATTSNNKPIHVDNSVHIHVNGSVVDHKKLMDELQKHQDKQHRMKGLHIPVSSGGRAR